MDIICLPLAPSQRAKLASAGYTTLDSIHSLSPFDLASEINVSHEEALDILKVAWHRKGMDVKSPQIGSLLAGAKTAWDLLCEEKTVKHIITSCADLDLILGGGINCKEVTEVGGVPGIGKTQLGIQLAINVQIPKVYGGLGGQAVYIDTEGSFMVERVIQIAEACIQRLKGMSCSNVRKEEEDHRKLHVDDFLSNIFYFRVCNYTEQIAAVNHMDKFVEEHKEVKIIIVDSVTFHFRQEFEDLALRTRLLGGMAQKLMKLAVKYDNAVVLINQVTMKVSGGSFQLAPALGETWSHACTNRLILYWNGNSRSAYIDKSPYLQSASAPFLITPEGICNVGCNKSIKMPQ
ncbi:hypothetical protein SUGI_0498070 [Cryptomeria japonica]|uniref:DNA repair protein RAD51 homolog 3 isoform X2 n=1 Tax=Cryptomeria japonica TaxID=3369 RepID=UPI002408E687|nr:DNA repair protein RAD51 homolog 3 isoform X2 [Cryptomeria japonica]GLJ25972.1 hypothetical protein SUGI_0498070 [Cryptomeria japonica]